MELIFPTKKKLLNNFYNFFVNIGSKLAETILPKHQTKLFDSYLKDRCFSTLNFMPDEVISVQARSKQCLIGPEITKLSAGDLGAG